MVSQIIKIFICVLTVKMVCGRNVLNSNDAEQYEVSYYDPQTGVPLLGKLMTGSNDNNGNSTNLPGLSIFGYNGLPCECKDLSCSCCAGIKINAIKLDRKACIKFTFEPKDLAIKMSMLWNDKEVYKNQVSAKNPPPVCMSIPGVPLVKFCVRFTDVSLVNNNLRTCIDFETQIASQRVLVLHFNCVEIGAGGIHWDAVAYTNALPSKPETEDVNVYDEVEFEQSDLEPLADVGSSQTLSPEEQQIGQLKV